MMKYYAIIKYKYIFIDLETGSWYNYKSTIPGSTQTLILLFLNIIPISVLYGSVESVRLYNKIPTLIALVVG